MPTSSQAPNTALQQLVSMPSLFRAHPSMTACCMFPTGLRRLWWERLSPFFLPPERLTGSHAQQAFHIVRQPVASPANVLIGPNERKVAFVELAQLRQPHVEDFERHAGCL